MYNSDLVRKLCGDILHENDPGRVQDLISLLQAVLKEDQEEIPNQNGLPRQEVRGCPQRLAGCGLGHSNLSHLYGTCSKQVRHLRQTNHAAVGNGEEGKPVHEECFVAKIRLSRHNPPATE